MTNKIECAYCGAIIESKYGHDFQTHACDKMQELRGKDYFIAVDGGKDYWKRCGTKGGDWIERGIEET